MLIYLKKPKSNEWELKKGTLKELKKDLKIRDIIISDTAIIGYRASIGAGAIIGYRAYIGDSATIGKYATIGDSATIGAEKLILKN